MWKIKEWKFRAQCKKISFEQCVRKKNFYGSSDTTKLIEENLCRTLDDINCIKIFYDPHPKAMKIKTKISKWNLIKRFCTAKEIINKMKRHPSEWEKIFANKATDKGLIS